jgi:hypothetical protein
MTKQEQLIVEAMAKVDGWRVCSWNGKLYKGLLYANKVGLPAYLTDENHISRMVRGLSKEDGQFYAVSLVGVCDDSIVDAVRATIAQKVEAYLKAKGLWTKEMEL